MIAAKHFFPGACVVKVINLLKNGYQKNGYHFVHVKTFFIILRYYTTQPIIITVYSSKTNWHSVQNFVNICVVESDCDIVILR